MPGNVSSRWPQVPCRNDHSGTIRGGNCDRNTGNTEHCSTCLLQYYNESDKCQSHGDTPSAYYIGLYVHSRFMSGKMVDELARLWLSVNYCLVMYLDKKMGLSVIQQFSVLTSPGTIHRWRYRQCWPLDHNPCSTTSAEYFP